MRIAIISTMEGYPWGGSEELWAAAARAALEDGHTVLVSVKRWPATSPTVIELQEAGATIFFREVYPEDTRAQRLAARLLKRNRWRTWSELADFAPDVVLVSQGGTFEFSDPNYYGRLFDLLTQGTTPYILLCQWNDESFTLLESARRRAKLLFGKASALAVVSARQIPVMERQGGTRLPNAKVLRNPVMLSDPQRPQPWPTGDAVRLACVGRLDIQNKGQDVLLAALGAPKWVRRPWELTLFGDGPDRGHLAELARMYGLEDRVRFAGHVSDVRAIWHEHQLLALPSRNEGTSLAMVEAMLCGRPALVTDVGGAAEWVEDEVSGFVAPCPAEASIGEALDRAWEARPRWESMGRSAHRRAMALYDPDAGRSLLRLLYRSVT